MTTEKRYLIVRLARFAEAVEQIEYDASVQYDWDSQMDGGEFSGPAIRRQIARRSDARARALGFANAEVAGAIADAFLRRAQ